MMAFDDTDGSDERHELAAEGILRRMDDGTLEDPIEIDDHYIDNVNATGLPVWSGSHLMRVLDYLDELRPDHGLSAGDFQEPPSER